MKSTVMRAILQSFEGSDERASERRKCVESVSKGMRAARRRNSILATFAGRSRHTPSEMVIQSETQAKFQPQGSFQNAVGGKPGPPLPFGSYETGRSGDPRFHCEPTAAFKDRMPRSSNVEKQMGDPGAYDPWAFDDQHRVFGYSKNRKSFDSTAIRDMNLRYAATLCTPPPNAPTH